MRCFCPSQPRTKVNPIRLMKINAKSPVCHVMGIIPANTHPADPPQGISTMSGSSDSVQQIYVRQEHQHPLLLNAAKNNLRNDCAADSEHNFTAPLHHKLRSQRNGSRSAQYRNDQNKCSISRQCPTISMLHLYQGGTPGTYPYPDAAQQHNHWCQCHGDNNHKPNRTPQQSPPKYAANCDEKCLQKTAPAQHQRVGPAITNAIVMTALRGILNWKWKPKNNANATAKLSFSAVRNRKNCFFSTTIIFPD